MPDAGCIRSTRSPRGTGLLLFERPTFFQTLTGLGYPDITPTASPSYSLSWLESVFGQFYIAVVVAQLVGLRLAEVIKRSRPDSR